MRLPELVLPGSIRPRADVDVCAVVGETGSEDGARLQAIARRLNVDALFVRTVDMPRADRPAHAVHEARPFVGWAVHRAHVALPRESMPAFVDFVRPQVPIVEPRMGGPPRWT